MTFFERRGGEAGGWFLFSNKKEVGAKLALLRHGLGEKIRTSGLLNPIQARYQTAPHPVVFILSTSEILPLIGADCQVTSEESPLDFFLALFLGHALYFK